MSDSPAAILFDELGNPIGVSFDGQVFRLAVDAVLNDGYQQSATETNPLRVDPVGQTVQPIVGVVVCQGNAPVDYKYHGQPVVVSGVNQSDNTIQIPAVNSLGVLSVQGSDVGTPIPMLEYSISKKYVNFQLYQDGYGADLAVNASLHSPQIYTFPASITNNFYMYEMRVSIIASTITNMYEFGQAPQLENGLSIKFDQTGNLGAFEYSWANTAEIFAEADLTYSTTHAYSNGAGLISAKFKFSPPVLFIAANSDTITATVQDDLTENTSIYIEVSGLLG